MNSIHPLLSDLRMIHTYVPTSYIQLTKLNQPTAPPRLLPRTCFSSFYASNNFDLFQPPIAQQHMHTRGGRGYNYSVTSAGLAPGGWGTYIQYNMYICSNLSSVVGIVVGPYYPLGWIGIISQLTASSIRRLRALGSVARQNKDEVCCPVDFPLRWRESLNLVLADF